MTDHDRGAYTPQTDAPLAFDARQPRGGGGGGGGSPTTLIVSGIVLVLLIVAVVVFYRGGVRGTNEAPQPVGVPVGELKSAAPADAQPPAAEPPMAVYDSGQPAGETAFAPTPEQPLPRPAARPTVNIQTNDLEPAGPPPVRPPPPAAPPRPLPGPVAAQPKPAAPAPGPVAAQPRPVITPAPAAGGAAVVQIGAFSSEALANKGWSDVASAFPGDMSGKGRRVESVDSNGATLYRGQVTGFPNREAASAFCGKLKAAGKSCIVK